MYTIDGTVSGNVDNLIDTIEAVNDILEEEALDIAIEFEPEIQALGTNPGKSQFEDGFATEKSKRYYFWAVNKGLIPTDGKNYIRQSKSPFGWGIDVEDTTDGIVIRVGNAWSKARYVFGNRAGQRQVPGHKRTGWQLAGRKAMEIASRLNFELGKRVFDRLQEYRK